MTEEKPQRWYNSKLASGVGVSFIILASSVAIPSCIRSCGEFIDDKTEINRVEPNNSNKESLQKFYCAEKLFGDKTILECYGK